MSTTSTAQIVGVLPRLQNPAEPADPFALGAHPAGVDRVVTGLLDGGEGFAVGGKGGVQLVFKPAVDRAAGDGIGDRLDQAGKGVGCHGALASSVGQLMQVLKRISAGPPTCPSVLRSRRPACHAVGTFISRDYAGLPDRP